MINSLPDEWEIVVWNNGWSAGPERGVVGVSHHPRGIMQQVGRLHHNVGDLSVYGRYAAIEYASHELIYVQDDDVIVSDPQAITDEWWDSMSYDFQGDFDHKVPDLEQVHVVCNMPQEFRHDGYTDSALVGFGAAFHREAPARAWGRFFGSPSPAESMRNEGGIEWFQRTCDVVFTTLTERVLVDVPKVNREFAEDADRMYRQPDHVGERARMLELARKVRG